LVENGYLFLLCGKKSAFYIVLPRYKSSKKILRLIALIVLRIRIRGTLMFLGLPDPDPDPLVRGMVRIRIRIPPSSQKGVALTAIMLCKYNFDAKLIFKAVDKRLKIMCLRVSYEKKKSLKKGVGYGSVIQRFGSGSAPKCHGSPTLVRYLLDRL
jgi:hypothetical protein